MQNRRSSQFSVRRFGRAKVTPRSEAKVDKEVIKKQLV
jgi:hypothetical protein